MPDKEKERERERERKEREKHNDSNFFSFSCKITLGYLIECLCLFQVDAMYIV